MSSFKPTLSKKELKARQKEAWSSYPICLVELIEPKQLEIEFDKAPSAQLLSTMWIPQLHSLPHTSLKEFYRGKVL